MVSKKSFLESAFGVAALSPLTKCGSCASYNGAKTFDQMTLVLYAEIVEELTILSEFADIP
jgi:hypothetical protein